MYRTYFLRFIFLYNIIFLRCEIENEHGMQEHLFSLYVTVAGGMDFRAMLMRKKKPAKKVVVVSDTIFDQSEASIQVT